MVIGGGSMRCFIRAGVYRLVDHVRGQEAGSACPQAAAGQRGRRQEGLSRRPDDGAAGAVSATGDLIDGYSVRLLPGQVVELDFNADPAQVDIDLFLYDAQRQLVGQSVGTNSYECIRITTEGDYALGVELYQGSRSGSIYQLRVTPPGEGME